MGQAAIAPPGGGFERNSYSKAGGRQRYIQRGKPDQNAYIERFNRSYREEVLSAYVFGSIEQVRLLTDDWPRTYNEVRPHDSLGRVPPLTFLPRPNRPVESSYQVSTRRGSLRAHETIPRKRRQ